MTSLRRSLRASAAFGVGPLASYATYRLGLLTGWLRRQTPDLPWEAWTLATQLDPGVPTTPSEYIRFRANRDYPRFFFDSEGPNIRLPAGEARSVADRIPHAAISPAGRTGLGRPWNAMEGEAKEVGARRAARHWSTYDLARLGVDTRLLWEANRFGWSFPLARSYFAVRDSSYAESFWRLWESWRDENLPYRGVQWASAQEVALRLLSLVFAVHAFGPAWRRRPARIVELVEAILAHAARIPPTLSYSRAQGNNHLLSEAAALYTAGLLFPEARRASEWRHVGRALFLEGIGNQVFADGGYIQHSANYHRLALQLGLWVARLAALNRDPLPEDTTRGLGRLTVGLAVLVDSTNGRPARFGPDDSSDIFPMGADTGYDYRPTLQAAARLFHGSPLYPPGRWDEMSAWLGLAVEAPRSVRKPPSSPAVPSSLPEAGLYRLAGRGTWGLLRAARFRTRPGHSDQLHADLWWRGENIAFDPGSFLYQAPAPWDGGLAEAEVHNTVTVDGADPMERAGPFLWLDWAQADLLGTWTARDGSLEVTAAEHHGYTHVTHRRTLARAGEHIWIVVDDIFGSGEHRVTLGWNLPDSRWKLKGNVVTLRSRSGPVRISLDGGDISVYRAGVPIAGKPAPSASPRWGWWCPVYGRREPCLRLVASRSGTLPVRLTTWWSLGNGPGPRPMVEWNPAGEGPAAIRQIRLGRTSLKTGAN